MSWVDTVYNALLYLWAVVHTKYPLLGFITAVTVSLLSYVKRKDAINIAESLLCGVFAAIGVTCSEFVSKLIGYDIPVEVYSFMSGAIGWYGTNRTAKFLEGRFDRILGSSNNEDDSKGV